MGLFDAFQGGTSVPGIYAPWMTYGQGSAPDITPSHPVQPAGPLDTSSPQPVMPHSGGLFSGWNTPDPNTGLSKWQQLQMVGANLRDDPAVASATQNAMMEQSKAGLANQAGQLNLQAAREKQAMLHQAFGMMNGAPAEQAPQVGAPSPQGPMPAQGGPMMPQVGAPPQAPMTQAPGGAPQAAPFQQSVPSLPGVRPSPLTPQMRKALGIMALVDGHPDQAATIMDDRKKITAGPDGWMYDQDTGEVIGRLPSHSQQNGFNVDLGAPNAPSYIPKLPDGMMPDGRGGVQNLAGLPAAMGAQTAATAGATARAQAGQDVIEVKMPDGSTMQMPRDLAAALTRQGMLGGQGAGAGGAGAPGGLGRSQTPADAAAAKGMADIGVEQYKGIQTAGQSALTNIPKYKRLGELLDGISGNRFSPTGVELAQIARTLPGLGNFDAKLPNKEAAAAIANQLALSLRDPSQGGGMPGAMSDSDRKFLLSSVPNLAQTAQGRRMMVDAAVKLNQRNADVATKARQWVGRFGRIDKPDAAGKTFADYLNAWSSANPLFGSAQ
jgi:hypothetical protein